MNHIVSVWDVPGILVPCVLYSVSIVIRPIDRVHCISSKVGESPYLAMNFDRRHHCVALLELPVVGINHTATVC